MAPLTRKRKLLNHDDIEEVVLADDDCEHEAATPPLLHPRSTSTHSRSKRAEDDDTSISVMLSKSSIKVAKKGGQNAQDVRRDVEALAEDVKAFIKNELCHGLSSSQMPSIRDLVAKALPDSEAFVLPAAGNPRLGQTPAITNTCYNKSRAILEELRMVTSDYERLSQQGSDIETPTWSRWEQDGADLHSLNASLMRYSIKLVEKNLIPNGAGDGPNVIVDDVDQIALELLEDSGPVKGEETWGNVANGILQTMSDAAELLP